MKIVAERCVIDFTFYSPEAIVYFQFLPLPPRLNGLRWRAGVN